MATVKKKVIKSNPNIKTVKINLLKERIVPFGVQLAKTGSGQSLILMGNDIGQRTKETRWFEVSITNKLGKKTLESIPTLLVKKPLGTGPDKKKKK